MIVLTIDEFGKLSIDETLTSKTVGIIDPIQVILHESLFNLYDRFMLELRTPDNNSYSEERFYLVKQSVDAGNYTVVMKPAFLDHTFTNASVVEANVRLEQSSFKHPDGNLCTNCVTLCPSANTEDYTVYPNE